MSYRGPALQYQIRKTTTQNKTGDNFAITIPRVIAQQFINYYFKLSISGNNIILESGCKLTVHDINEKQEEKDMKRIYIKGRPIVFK